LPYGPDDRAKREARITAQSDVYRMSELLGVPEKEIEETIQRKIREQIEGRPIAIRRGLNGALSVLRNGRFMTQFETGMSGGTFDPYKRAKAEEMGLGTPKTIDDEKRPVYGYVLTEAEHLAAAYGPIEFILKDSAKARTTVTVGDSLYKFEYGEMVGSPLSNPGMECWDRRGSYIYEDKWVSVMYMETQIHGGVNLSDVDRVVLHRNALYRTTGGVQSQYKQFVDLAEELGVKVEYDTRTS